jgi:hypothetical protein
VEGQVQMLPRFLPIVIWNQIRNVIHKVIMSAKIQQEADKRLTVKLKLVLRTFGGK